MRGSATGSERRGHDCQTLKPGESEIEVEINGSDIDTLFRTAQQVSERLRERSELTNVYISLDYSKPEWQVEIDRIRAGELGLTVAGIADTLRGYIGGHVPTQYREGNDLFDLHVIVPERSLTTRSGCRWSAPAYVGNSA
jgi:HAE1 family hydrophobic/amphiphilic exporter-1